jgi:hypothetical protein
LGQVKTEIFLQKGLDSPSADLPVGQNRRAARMSASDMRGCPQKQNPDVASPSSGAHSRDPLAHPGSARCGDGAACRTGDRRPVNPTS